MPVLWPSHGIQNYPRKWDGSRKEAGQFGYRLVCTESQHPPQSLMMAEITNIIPKTVCFSAKTAAAVAGSKDMESLLCKHLICNDQESGIYRDGVYTWMTEQALRETYLKPFQMIVQERPLGLCLPTTV